MQLTIKIEKRHLIFLAVIVCLIFVVGVYAFNSVPSDPSVFGHDDSEILNVSASKVVPGQFGSGVYTFPQNLIVNGNAKIGVSNPADNSTRLQVLGGPINASGGLIIEVRASDPPAGELYKGRIWLIG